MKQSVPSKGGYMGKTQERHVANLAIELEPLMQYLDDPQVTDVMINPNASIWVKKQSSQSSECGMLPASQTRRIILMTASLMGKTVNSDNPDLDGIIPLPGMTARISAFVEPWTTSPTFCIRKPAKKIFALHDYLHSERMRPAQFNAIQKAVKEHRNIIVSGGTGSGKTTLLNAIISQIVQNNDRERLYIIEDTAEIQCRGKNSVSAVVPSDRTAHAVRKALRYFPDRIIFGELRYGETALELLKAWNTGHPGGVSTIHANSADTVHSRLTGLVSEVMKNRDQCVQLINDSIDMIIHLQRGACVKQILDKGGEV